MHTHSPGQAHRLMLDTSDALKGHIVHVAAPSRLHLGFLDPSGSLGRSFGGVGLMIEGFDTVLRLGGAPQTLVTAQASLETQAAEEALARARSHLQTLMAHTGLHTPVHLHVAQLPHSHAGFGSGTQLALAVGRAFAQWHGLNTATPSLAQWLGRGKRSGIGIAGFDQGGLLLDGGPQADGRPAPVLSRLLLPPSWCVLLLMDKRCKGLSGAAEKQAIAALPPLPQHLAADVCHRMLMQVLPGAACADFALFAAGLNHVQDVLGSHFAAAQNGSAYSSQAVGRVMRWMAQASVGLACPAMGQSSWGPTGFAFMPSEQDAQHWLAAAATADILDPALDVQIVRPSVNGARVW